MEGKITVMQLILMLCGLALSLIIFIDGNSSDKSWLKRNGLKMIGAVIIAYVGVIVGPTIFKICGVTIPEGNELLPDGHAFLCGFLSDVLLFGLIRLKQKLRGEKKQTDSAETV